MNNIERLIQEYILQHILPSVEHSVKKAIKEALSEYNKQASPDNDPFYNAKNSAAYIDDKLSTFYKRIYRKEIPRHGPPGRIFCKKSDLDTFISQKQSKSIRQMHTEIVEAMKTKPKRRGRGKII